MITFVFASALGRGAVEQASATDWLNYCLSRRHSAVLDRQKQPIDTQHTARVSGKQSRSGPSIQTDRNVWHKVWLSNPTCSMPDCLSVHKLPRHSYMIMQYAPFVDNTALQIAQCGKMSAYMAHQWLNIYNRLVHNRILQSSNEWEYLLPAIPGRGGGRD